MPARNTLSSLSYCVFSTYCCPTLYVFFIYLMYCLFPSLELNFLRERCLSVLFSFLPSVPRTEPDRRKLNQWINEVNITLKKLNPKLPPRWDSIWLYSPVQGLPQWLNRKESACSAGATGDAGSSLGWKDPLEESMATHSSILAWRIPWTGEPGRLQSVGSQSQTRLSDWAHTHVHQWTK